MLIKLGTRVPYGRWAGRRYRRLLHDLSAQGLSARVQRKRSDAELPRSLLSFRCARLAASKPGATQRRTSRSTFCASTANGDIYAEGVDELLYGRLSNVL